MHLYFKVIKKWSALVVSIVLVLLLAIPSVATDYEEELEILGDTIDELEDESADIELQLSEINEELIAANQELEDITLKIELTESEMARTIEDLAQSKIDEAEQYASMKTRIQYMYEGGSISLFEVLLGAESIAEFINLVDFVNNVTEYDRNMLDELTAVREAIEFEEANLEDEERALYELQQNALQATEELQAIADELSLDLDTVLAELAEIQAEEERLEQEAAEAQAEAERLEAERLEAERLEAEQEAANNNSSNDSSSDDSSSDSSSDTSTDSSYNASASDVELLAALLDCEAISDYDSMLAVATIVMNRVASSKFPNTIYGVVYDSGQFSPTWTGKLDRRMELGATSLAYQVAEDAIAGARLSVVSHCYYFLYAGSTSRDGINIGDNLFFVSW